MLKMLRMTRPWHAGELIGLLVGGKGLSFRLRLKVLQVSAQTLQTAVKHDKIIKICTVVRPARRDGGLSH